MNLFERHKPLVPGTLWLLDQAPGHIAAADVTAVLSRQSYFPSYNIPYFASIFNVTGCQQQVQQYGDWFSYDKAPRALMFARDHSGIVDIAGMQRIMRYNDFKVRFFIVNFTAFCVCVGVFACGVYVCLTECVCVVCV